MRLSFLLSAVTKRVVIFGKPESLSVEPTNKCNLNCIECPTGTGDLTRKTGKMDFHTFKNIIDKTYKHLSYLILYFQGEPFLNSQLYDMISYAGKKNIFTYTSTNGHFLTPENCKKIVESKLDKITISLDGTNQETYQIYRKNGDFNKVTAGIKNLVEVKKQLNSIRPFIELQFLVFKHNQNQISEIKLLAKQLGVNKLSLKTAQFYNKENIKYLTDIEKFARYKVQNNKLMLKKKPKNRCWRMWHSSVVSINGDIAPCCFDKDTKYTFGNTKDVNISNIRKTSTYKYFAKKILLNRKSIDICNNCNN